MKRLPRSRKPDVIDVEMFEDPSIPYEQFQDEESRDTLRRNNLWRLRRRLLKGLNQ